MSLPRLSLLLLVLACGCSVEDTPSAAVVTSGPPVSRAPEAQDPCTQLVLTRLDGQLGAEPSAGPEDIVRANEVVAEFVQAYDKVLVGGGIEAARAAVAADVAAACAVPAGQGNVVEIPVEEQPAASPSG